MDILNNNLFDGSTKVSNNNIILISSYTKLSDDTYSVSINYTNNLTGQITYLNKTINTTWNSIY